MYLTICNKIMQHVKSMLIEHRYFKF